MVQVITKSGRKFKQFPATRKVGISYPITGIAYCPKERNKKPLVTSGYYVKMYIRKTEEEALRASEQRKKELLQNLENTRKEIRVAVEKYHADANTLLVAKSAKEKRILHVYRLIDKLNKYWIQPTKDKVQEVLEYRQSKQPMWA